VDIPQWLHWHTFWCRNKERKVAYRDPGDSFMIRYRLICSAKHEFDQWFDNMADYDAKKDASAIVCPECGDTHVSKALMAPSLPGTGGHVSSMPEIPACAGAGAGSGCGGCPALAD
jgi:hypothetical protein